MEDILIAGVLVAIGGGAIAYIVRAKRRGAKCIGCSVGEGACSEQAAHAEGGCSCGCGSADKIVANMENAAK